MRFQKFLLGFICVVTLSNAQAQVKQNAIIQKAVAEASQPVKNEGVTSEMSAETSKWRQTLRQAVEGASDRLQTNLVTVLNGLAVTTAEAGQNVTIALATLTRATVTNTFDLVGVVAYMPKLLLLDLPTQFVEVLRLIRRNEVRLPSDVNGAIDSILAMTRQAEESGITRQIFDPITNFLPNMLSGVHEFLQTIIGTMANVFGAGGYRYDPELNFSIPARY